MHHISENCTGSLCRETNQRLAVCQEKEAWVLYTYKVALKCDANLQPFQLASGAHSLSVKMFAWEMCWHCAQCMKKPEATGGEWREGQWWHAVESTKKNSWFSKSHPQWHKALKEVPVASSELSVRPNRHMLYVWAIGKTARDANLSKNNCNHCSCYFRPHTRSLLVTRWATSQYWLLYKW